MCGTTPSSAFQTAVTRSTLRSGITGVLLQPMIHNRPSTELTNPAIVSPSFRSGIHARIHHCVLRTCLTARANLLTRAYGVIAIEQAVPVIVDRIHTLGRVAHGSLTARGFS